MPAHQSESVDFDAFIEIHLRCGAELTYDAFESFGNLLLCALPPTQDEMDAHEWFFANRLEGRGGEASEDEDG